MKITVVTVCRNAENSIRKTIESVLDQHFTDYEFLIIDGASTDGTMSVIESYSVKFAEKNIPFRCISEPDNGIYDAMNKAIDRAGGEWILFMNSGDSFFDGEVLNRLIETDVSGYDIVYGNVLITENNMYKFNPAGIITDQGFFSPICHQGMMTRTAVLRDHTYDTSLRLAADYDSMIRIHKDGGKFKKTDLTVAVFELGGTSFKQSIRYLKEMYVSRKSIGIVSAKNQTVSVFLLGTYLFIRRISKMILGKRFYSENRGWKKDTELFD